MVNDDEERYGNRARMDCPVLAGTPCWIYARDSGGENQEESVDQQLGVARVYTRRHQLLVRDSFIDPAQVSTNIEKRVEINKMLDKVRTEFPLILNMKRREKVVKTPLFAIVVWKLSRLSRDGDYRASLRAEMILRGGVIVELDGEPSTGNKMVDSILSLVSDITDQEQIKQNGRDAKRGLAAIVGLRDTDPKFREQNPEWPTSDGRYMSISPGRPPTGFRGEYVIVGIKERKRKTGTLRELHRLQRWVPDDRDGLWERCKLAWKMRLEEQNIEAIHKATRLFKTTGGYTGFFRNSIYTGDYKYGNTVYHNFVEAMITLEEFNAEQVRIALRAEKLRGKAIATLEPRRVISRHLLSGLLRCGAVSGEEHAMYGGSVPANEKRTQWDFYICTRKKASHSERCNAPRVGAKALEEAVIDKIMNEIVTRANLQPLVDNLAASLGARNAALGTELATRQSHLDDIQQAIERLIDAIEEDDGGSLESLKGRLKKREAEKRKLEAEVAGLKKELVGKTDIPLITDAKLTDYILSIHNALTGDDIDLAKRIIRRLVAKIVVHGEMGTIYYSFPFQDISSDGTVPLSGFEPEFQP